METNNTSTIHSPVLLSQTIEILKPKAGESYLDLTAGYGGHAEEFLSRIGTEGTATLVDRDKFAIDHLREKFTTKRVELIKSSYLDAVRKLSSKKRKFDLVLMDIGVSSPQLDIAERGFSLLRSGPIDMRMDQDQDLSAYQMVNELGETELADLIYRYGEEKASRAIAKAIVANRPIKTTVQLASIIESTSRRREKIHPATRTFQALRIAVNDELGQLEATLPNILNILEDGGRLGIISFHSLEDRIVKKFMRENSSGYEAKLELLTKKPIVPANEDVYNPRARSAKLRAAVKIKTERG